MIKEAINKLKMRLTAGWGLMRILRLGLGLLLVTEAFGNADLLFGFLGTVLLAQSLLNAGCCGTSGCATGYSRAPAAGKAKEKDISYEEVR